MIKTLIIDDEPLARKVLKNYLEDNTDIEIVGECANGFDGIKTIAEKRPDLVFLDVQMPKLNGFEMLELLDEMPEIIFTTAFDQYAVRAFENNAIDYLLKPFSKERLTKAIMKVKERLANHSTGNLKDFIDTNTLEASFIDRIAVKTGSRIHIIYTQDIWFLESQDDYVMIYTENGKYLKQKTMKYFEAYLSPGFFCRVHRSYMVRLDFIDRIELYDKESYILKLKNNQSIPVSKSGYTRLREVLNF